MEAAKGQLAMCQVYIQTIMELAYVAPSDPTKDTRTISFTMDDATVDFNMEVKESLVDTSSNTSSLTNTDGFHFWGCNASITGNVAASLSHTRTTDSSAKYSIHARAVQQPPAEGMAKLTALFAANIPMLCHSCYAPLSRDAVFIGNHQPSTSLYRLRFFFMIGKSLEIV